MERKLIEKSLNRFVNLTGKVDLLNLWEDVKVWDTGGDYDVRDNLKQELYSSILDTDHNNNSEIKNLIKELSWLLR